MKRRHVQFVWLAAFLGLAAFVAGTRFLGRQATPQIHPLTGRQIAGIATDAAWMDRAEREREEDPERALDLLGIAPGIVVADVGAGSGYMTVRLAARVGPAGRVFAEDVQPALLELIQSKCREQRLSNVETVLGTEDDPRLPAGAVDLALLVDVYHEFRHPQHMLQSIRRSLKPEGRLVLIEYRSEDPSIPIAYTHRMSVSDARTEVEAEGFLFDRLVAALPRQHLIVFRTHQP